MKQKIKQSGGFTYPITNNSILKFIKGDTRQHCDRYGVDCAPMILSFIGFSPEEIKILQKEAIKNYGTNIDKVLDLIQTKIFIPEDGYLYWEDLRPDVPTGINIYSELVNMLIFKSYTLENNHGYLLFLARPDMIGHFVLLVRIDNLFYIFDPQQEQQIPNPICTDDWMLKRNELFNQDNRKFINCDLPPYSSNLRYQQLVDYFTNENFQEAKILKATDVYGNNLKTGYTHNTISNLAQFDEYPEIDISANSYMKGIIRGNIDYTINNDVNNFLTTGLSSLSLKKKGRKTGIGKKKYKNSKYSKKKNINKIISSVLPKYKTRYSKIRGVSRKRNTKQKK
jgi:hypothetical protein